MGDDRMNTKLAFAGAAVAPVLARTRSGERG
jgi:hypothetical protein